MPVGRQGDKTCLVLFISINGARKYSQKNCHQERDPNATQMGNCNCILYRKLLLLVLMDQKKKKKKIIIVIWIKLLDEPVSILK